MSTGMNVTTGKAISDVDHIWQSCRDIITTLIGTRLQRRDYGSLVPELIDHPHNAANNLRLRAATVMAIAKWEPRVSIRSINVYISGADGATIVDMLAVRNDQPENVNTVQLNIPIGGLR